MNEHAKVQVTDDGLGVPGSKSHCAIANALMLSDSDIVYAKADKQFIRFSRRSTGLRYVFATPARAAKFINKFDDPDRVGPVHDEFTLRLTDDNLVGTAPRKKVKREQSVRYRAPGRKVTKPSPLRNRSSSSRGALSA